MERRVRRKVHARCEAGEKVESGAAAPLKPYLSPLLYALSPPLSNAAACILHKRRIFFTKARGGRSGDIVKTNS